MDLLVFLKLGTPRTFGLTKFKASKKHIQALSITAAVGSLIDTYFTKQKKQEKALQPQVFSSETELIKRADDLFNQHRFFEVYELLEQMQHTSNSEILWRLARALFAASHNESFSKPVRQHMVTEAFYLIKSALNKQDNNADVHIWMAILLDHTSGYAGTLTRTKALPEVKQHLLRASELNPTDVTTLYLLGQWCYQLAILTWFQRKLAAILYVPPPESSLEEAYHYFLKAEHFKPRFFIGNVYMLGKINYCMKQYYRAKYYLDLAANMPCLSERQKEFHREAKKLSNELHLYDLLRNALFYEPSDKNDRFDESSEGAMKEQDLTL